MFALGLGFLAQFFTVQGLPILAVPYYQMTLGVDPFLLSIAMMGPLCLGSVLGPWVGHLSDTYQSRFGRRRPFIAVGAWGLCVSYGLVWMVPQHWSSSAQLMYFAATGSIFYIAGAVYTVPLTSMVYELSDDPHQRTRLLGFTTYFFKTGSLMYQWVFPLAQLAIFGSVVVGIKYVGWGLGLLVFGVMGTLPALFIKERRLPSVKPALAISPSSSVLSPDTFQRSMKAIIDNRSMRLLVAVVFIQMGGSAWVAMMDYYLLVYFVHAGDIETGAIWKGGLSTAYALAGMGCVPLVVYFSRVVGKLNALKAIFILNVLGGLAKWFIFVPSMRWGIIVDAVLCSAIWTAMVVLVPSMVSDLNAAQSKADTEESIRKGSAKEGESRTHAGAYAAVHGWAVSFAGMLAFIASGLTLNLIGFEASAGPNQSDSAIFNMRVILCGGTVLFSVFALAILHYFDSSRQNSPKRKTFTS